MAGDISYGAETGSFSEFSTNTTAPAGVTWVTDVKHSGARSMKCTKAGTTAVYQILTPLGSTDGKPANASRADWYGNFGIRYTANPSAQVVIVYFKNTGGSVKASLRLNTGGTLSLYDLSGNLLATSTATVTDSAFHVAQVYIGTGAAGAGHWSFKLDNVAVDSGTTATLSSTNHGMLNVGFPGGENVSLDGWYDDIIVCTTGFADWTSKVGLLKPDGNSATNTGYSDQGSLGAKWKSVGEGPPASTTNWIDATSAAVYTATMQNSSALLGASDTVTRVVGWVSHSKHTSAGAEKFTMRSGGSPANTVLGTGAADPNTGSLVFGQLYDQEPIGATAWTQTLLDGVEIGATYSSGTHNGVDECYLCVEYIPASGTLYTHTAAETLGFGDASSKTIARKPAETLAFGESSKKSIARKVAETLAFGEGSPKTVGHKIPETLSFGEGSAKALGRKAADSLGFAEASKKTVARATRETLGFGESAAKSIGHRGVEVLRFAEGSIKAIGKHAVEHLPFAESTVKTIGKIAREILAWADTILGKFLEPCPYTASGSTRSLYQAEGSTESLYQVEGSTARLLDVAGSTEPLYTATGFTEPLSTAEGSTEG